MSSTKEKGDTRMDKQAGTTDTATAPTNEKASATPYRIWVAHCPFRKNGTPVLGNMGSKIGLVVVFEMKTWTRLCQDVPALATTQFEVGAEE